MASAIFTGGASANIVFATPSPPPLAFLSLSLHFFPLPLLTEIVCNGALKYLF
jgi:hypothetical protein